MAQVFQILYWIAIVGMSAVLALTTLMIFAIGFKFIKSKRNVLGFSCIGFSIAMASMIIFMVNYTFILPAS
ncbi:hypothetical protein [Paenibacillus macquariensis]|uniref:DUF2768 domain-containing protein n=1 Tax=Paenibacillus macquariensis TaxID=948756 RepID=A0ABY1JT27_9BACL|nr:hypothetical protein [Paenibacillus macquariensis]MEC0093019.1 hypothetical protein [Paenibacillus macquariensis]OAB36376.1 hypothetical protein PMSM_08000 [Paenibacillus macquariensis subsp. macquariensis]SIQ70786.1 hypothetical protein SAMN05421578_103480 [Paenibacillus macquariensis]